MAHLQTKCTNLLKCFNIDIYVLATKKFFWSNIPGQVRLEHLWVRFIHVNMSSSANEYAPTQPPMYLMEIQEKIGSLATLLRLDFASLSLAAMSLQIFERQTSKTIYLYKCLLGRLLDEKKEGTTYNPFASLFPEMSVDLMRKRMYDLRKIGGMLKVPTIFRLLITYSISQPSVIGVTRLIACYPFFKSLDPLTFGLLFISTVSLNVENMVVAFGRKEIQPEVEFTDEYMQWSFGTIIFLLNTSNLCV